MNIHHISMNIKACSIANYYNFTPKGELLSLLNLNTKKNTSETEKYTQVIPWLNEFMKESV